MAVPQFRIDQGIDIHPFADSRACILGGVRIDHPRGLAGHSDADALTHAVIDALLGASGMGDIGQLFPDTDVKWKGADSLKLLEMAWGSLRAVGWQVVNVDMTILAEAPRISPCRSAIVANISGALGIDAGCCGLKATTTEKLGFIGRSEGVLASCVVLLTKTS